MKNQLNLSSRFAIITILFLLLILLSDLSKAQNSINYSPTITGYNNEKVFKADIDQDGFLDLILYNQITNLVSVLKNNGSTTFNHTKSDMAFSPSSFQSYTLTSGEILLDIIDMDNDQKPDLLTSFHNATLSIDEISFHKNLGASFTNATTINPINYSIPHGNYEFGNMDLDNDNDVDVYAYSSLSNILYFIVNGTSSFTQTSINFAAGPIRKFFKGHFTPSGFNELLSYEETPLFTNSSHNFQILSNNGILLSNSFVTNINPGTPDWEIFIGKITNDNYDDVIIYPADGAIYALSNIAGNSFTLPQILQSNISLPPSTQFKLDVANYIPNSTLDDIILIETTASVGSSDLGKVYLANNPLGTFPFPTRSNISTSPCDDNPIKVNSQDWKILHGDFNNDAKIDELIYNPMLGVIKLGLLRDELSSNYEGYCWPLSANPGQTINFYCSGEGSTKINIFRYESRNQNVEEIYMGDIMINLTTQAMPSNCVTSGCQWTSSGSLNIPNSWPSGYYAARLDNELCVSSYITFIVKNGTLPSGKKIALIANTNTWAAYNNYNIGAPMFGSKYDNDYNQFYSFFRPNANSNPTANIPNRTRAELWIFTWLKDNGYNPDVICDLDIHQNNGNFLNNYDYLIMGTHPEYWTGQMYDNVKDFQMNGGSGNGGNLLCIGGNAVFEACDIDLSNPNNPLLIAYPNSPGGATTQNNVQYPLNGLSGVGGSSNPSPFNNVYDRFDFFLESYNFGSIPLPVYKRSIDLIGTHYNIINNEPYTNSTTSYSLNPAITQSLIKGINSTIIGIDGYNQGWSIAQSGGMASGWECERYTKSTPPNLTTPASPLQTYSVYDDNIQIIATATPNTYTSPYSNFPNGLNYSEIIYVPAECGPNKRGFVFTAGSITFGGSLVWNYEANTSPNPYDNDISRLLRNVLEHKSLNLQLEVKNINCVGNSGSLQANCCNAVSYELQPGGLTNTSGNFPNLSSGIYTISAFDLSGNSVSKSFTISQPLINHCICQFGESLVSNNNVILLGNSNSSYLNNNYKSANGEIIHKTFYIDGVLTIDEDIIFDQCTLYFTPNSYIQIIGINDLDISNSTLEASCDYWGGIVANAPQQKLVIQNNSTIKDAHTAVFVLNDAVAEISNSNFVNNEATGIAFSNMSQTNYQGFVKASTFTSDASMLPPFTKTKIGISVYNVTDLNIGDELNLANPNSFSNLSTGILVSNVTSTTTPVSSHIGIYNNSFDNIKNTYLTGAFQDAQKINNCYNGINVWSQSNTNPPFALCTDVGPANGAAIFAKNTAPALTDALIDVSNTQLASPSLAFNNCDKGIVSVASSVNAKNLYMDNCLMGIMNSITTGNSYGISDNKLFNTFIGMQFLGENKASSVYGNLINTKSNPVPVGTNLEVIWPKGIEVNNYINNSDQLDIINNIINIPAPAGLGISLLNVGGGLNVSGNTLTISHPTNNSVSNYLGISRLNGIAVINSTMPVINNNIINANANSVFVPRNDMAGIYLNVSKGLTMQCNAISNVRFGMLAIGDCSNVADPKAIAGNVTTNGISGWLFRHLGSDGTFGNVGATTYDNNNRFLGSNYTAKVFRFCDGLTLVNSIFTNPSTLSATDLNGSRSFNIITGDPDDCHYVIESNQIPYTVYDCPIVSIISQGGNGEIRMTLDEALLIATDTKMYQEYAEIARWIDRKQLFDILLLDATFRNSNSILLSFFNSMQNENIAQLNLADSRLRTLIGSINEGQLSPQEIADAKAKNDLIDRTKLQDENEYLINKIYITILEQGIDAINSGDQIFISLLANECPYIAGTAVYKARSLFVIYEPGKMFDDLNLCNQSGVYKNSNHNGQGIFDQENEFLIGLLPINNNSITEPNDFNIYPNPATTQLTIDYHLQPFEAGSITIYDLMGRKCFFIDLNNNANKTVLNVSGMKSGIYTYKYSVNNISNKIGKLLIK